MSRIYRNQLEALETAIRERAENKGMDTALSYRDLLDMVKPAREEVDWGHRLEDEDDSW